ncbi:MAG: hypothetical protein ACREPG_07760 [Candidatus Binatia bacterium]
MSQSKIPVHQYSPFWCNRFGLDSFFKDFKTPVDGVRLMVDQLTSSRMIDAALAQKTPLTAYYENRYVEELEKEGFFKKLWQ